MFTVRDSFETCPTLMRDACCQTLMDMAEKNKDIVVLDSDLVNSSGLKPFFKFFPDRAIECGIAEANMIGIAAGLSAVGKVPFAHSFGCFASRRVCDQIMISCSYAKLNVRIIGSDPGVTAAKNGGTHMPFEDMGVLRSIPDITLIEPTDPVMMKDIIRQLVDAYGVYYIRMVRKEATSVYKEGSTFEIGKGNLLVDGNDVTIFASGIMVEEAINASTILKTEGISARVVDMFTWKPIDKEMIARCAKETGCFVTAENHNVVGGLGAAIAEETVKSCPVPIEMVGVQDRFGQVGSVPFLKKEYNLTAMDIIEAARKAVARKGK
ncbi:MAG: transketolase family protein [Oscillospiraceae bacterium]|nr:transketolase family protein [Oscillospiraceae bacterium]